MPTVLPNSSYLDYTSYRTTTATTVAEAYGIAGPPTPATSTINVALILPRANDPTALLQSDWGTRQKTLQQLENDGTLWSTYGADPADYAAARTALQTLGLPPAAFLGDPTGSDGYVSSTESRTIWLSLDPTQFQAVFGTAPYQDATTLFPEFGSVYYWNGNLSAPDGIDIAGLWFDTAPDFGIPPAVSNQAGGAAIQPQQGPQSIGNSLAPTPLHPEFRESNAYAGSIAQWFYDFPLTGRDVPTATIGLIEPGIGDALPAGATYTFQQGLQEFRSGAGIARPGEYYLVANNGQSYPLGNSGERSLDVGVATSASPGSRIGLYAGSGFGGASHSNVFTAFQSAFWDESNDPAVLSSSFSFLQQSAPGSPFAAAIDELFIDGALRNITTAMANNDWGSSWNFANGLANQAVNMSTPYAILVGGTSLTTLAAAPLDGTVSAEPTPADSVLGLAMAGNLAILWRLIEGGLTVLPSAVPDANAARTTLLEAVWNTFGLSGSNWEPGLTKAGASDGGVDTSEPTPWYQTAFGLRPTSVNPAPWGGTGRGAPDVSANAGGNMFYLTPGEDMLGLGADDGTSAATPFWAALLAQIDTVFVNQGLPHLGYANDLLYIAAAIAPPAFNDITYGNNVSSYHHGGAILSDGTPVTLTGFGYHAGPGYDLTTGLGSPNGMLLARALTAIGHAQMSGTSPDMLDADGAGWTSGADQSLLFQSMSAGGAAIGVNAGGDSFGFQSGVSGTFAWTNRFAQQSLQADFDPHLVRLYDKQAQGWLAQDAVSTGEQLSVSVNGSSANAMQGTLTSAFGFADFLAADGAVRVARPVAVADTARGADDAIAIVRLRQNGEDSLSLSFYKVDDFNGTIDSLRPGEAGYAAAAAARAYQTTAGDTSIHGPGYGSYAQAALVNVDANDHIAMKLTNTTSGHTYWAFAQANETVDGKQVGHLWSYGLNTWGWEDLYGGGDRDFNDLVVQLDFTSASGNGWLI